MGDELMMRRRKHGHSGRIVTTVLATVILVACTAPAEWRDSTRRTIDTTMEESKKTSKAVPPDVSQALLPPIEIKLPDGKPAPLEPRFDLTVSNAPAREVFMGLIEGTPYSMVVHPDVKGMVSLNLKEVTVPEAVEAIRQVYGYEYRRDGNRFLILSAEMQTRIFTVNYLNLVRQGASSTSISSGSTLGSTSTGTGTTTTGTTSGTTGGGGASTVQVSTQSQVDFWKNMESALKAIIGTDGGRKVIVNAQTGLVVVRAMPDELRVVEDYLGVTHATVNRQVVLEAKVVEVELKNEFQSGVNWSLIVNNSRGQLVDTRGRVFGGGTTGSGGTGTVASTFGGIFSLQLTSGDFSMLLDALKGQGEVQILSSPRVSTVNNQKAVIKVGGEEFFVTSVTSGGTTTTGGVTSTTTPSVGLTAFFSGISLDVTPQIDERNNIILHIHPSVSVFTEKTKSFSVSGQSFQLPLALSSIQESDNIVRAQSGQIIVIGGLMKEATTDQEASVPVLADVPLVGALFRHKNINRIKRELIILLKPTSINIGQDWNDVVGESERRMKQIRSGS